MKKIAIFASGSGSNAQKIVEHFQTSTEARVTLILANKPDAYVLERAKNLTIESVLFNRDTFYNTTQILEQLKDNDIDFIVLAGFLWLFPSYIIEQYPNKIVNIHPALLPKFGGKGMYGMKVHEAVVESKEKETGITIHYVNEKYDEGNVVFQAKFPVLSSDSAEDVATKIHDLEYTHFPKVIEELVLGK